MITELSKTYAPNEFRGKITDRWLKKQAFSAVPDERPNERRYVIMMPLPNVTGALHMGHAMDNVMQDLLIRWHRMKGDNTLWQPGTDHAGIATQAVVEKRLFELEGKNRHDIGRTALVQRIWAWKDEYQQRIVRQQQEMGCSADWNRQRFTMDAVCSAAVRETFFRLFADKLIYYGDRLVNWDCQLQTAVSDDEVYHETTASHLWYLKYPVIDPQPGEPEYVVVATTRPETMLGDTAVACHPDPAQALEERIREQEQRIVELPAREKPDGESELERLKKRKKTYLPNLELLVAMAREGRHILLPLLDRKIPLILDEWAKPEMGSGCVKITPAHDFNDYEVWRRHSKEIGIISILQPDGSLNENAGPYAGLDRFEARNQVVENLKQGSLVETIEDYDVEIGRSDRSKTPIEPYLSKQWFVRMGDVSGGIVCGRNTANQFKTPGLAQAAIDAADGKNRTPGRKHLTFYPPRYLNGYVSWLAEKRDWCISRQLWWGHRIPVWTASCEDQTSLGRILERLPGNPSGDMHIWIADREGFQHDAESALKLTGSEVSGPFEIQVCLRGLKTDEKYGPRLSELGFEQDNDVLDTWFSSALWPSSTLGWPDPENSPVEDGQTALGAAGEKDDSFSYYYPGSCLVTMRDIITLWVARMMIFGLYNHGDIPFSDCYVHAKIMDGKGVTMSKSKGNGIDPVDIIDRYGADAMRYILCDMETGMQDVRLPVQASCPSCKATVELSEAGHGQTIFTYLCTSCGAEFDVLGTMPDVPSSQIFSGRFEVGRNFCNKLWNAARFALMNLGEPVFEPLARDSLMPEDRWIFSRFSKAVREVSGHLHAYRPSSALSAGREFFWGEFCDWYLEMIKLRLQNQTQAPVARRVLAVLLDQLLRLLHPFVPFITEQLWDYLNQQAPERGITQTMPASELCVTANWPDSWEEWEDAGLEAEFDRLRKVISGLRDLRSRHGIPSGKTLTGAMKASGEALASLERHARLITFMARLSNLELGESTRRPVNSVTQLVDDVEILLNGVLDPVKERERLESQRKAMTAQLATSRKKLANENFLRKAPAGVVETERSRAEELQRKLDLLVRNLESLDG